MPQKYTTVTRPVIRGNRYAVSTRKPQATQAAEHVLRAGGNAFDAAVAGMAVLAVTDPAMTGIGGDAFLLVYDARSGRVVSINAGGTAPELASIEWYRRHAGGNIPVNDGLLAASLPTVVDACYRLLDSWGTMTFGTLLAPAIELAESGFPVSEYLAEYFSDYSAKLQKYPTTRRLYLDNGIPQPGRNLRNPDLARTLRRLADAEKSGSMKGRQAGLKAARDLFYRGDIAREIAAFCEANGGLYRYDDLASYAVKIEEPVSVDYRGYDVYKNASATQGPTELILLGLLEGFDLRSMGHNSPDAIHTGVEAAKLAYADRERYLGDADFINIPFDRLLSKRYAADRRALIDPRRASLDFRPGDVERNGQAAMGANVAGSADHQGDTSFLTVIDEQGNAVSFTPSLHSAFGTGVVAGDLGFILNCRGDLYHLEPGHPNALAPRKRARSTLTPTIILKDGKPFVILGSPGGDDQPLRIAQTILNILDYDMNVQEAIEAPRWSTTSFPASEFPHTMYPGHIAVEDRIAEWVHTDLTQRGHIVEVRAPWTMNATCAILVDPETGIRHAGADPRGDSYALAW